MSRQQLAEKCGVSRQTIANIEQGRFVPSLPVIMLICEAIDIKYGELISYCRRRGTRQLTGEPFNLPGGAGKGVTCCVDDKALMYIELSSGANYGLRRYQVQGIFVIEGEISIICSCCETRFKAGEFVSCDGVGCGVLVHSNTARLVVMSLPSINTATQLMFAGRKSGVSRFINLNESTPEVTAKVDDSFDFSVIRDLRKSRGMSHDDFLAASSITGATLQAIESNDRCPSLATLDIVARTLEVDLVDMLELARKGCCQSGTCILAAMSGIGSKTGTNVDMSLHQMRYSRFRMGYLSNLSDQDVDINPGNVYIAQEEFLFVINGTQVVNVGGRDYHLTAGQGLLFDGRGIHSYKVGANNQSFAIFTLKQDTLYNGPVDGKTGGTLYRFRDVME